MERDVRGLAARRRGGPGRPPWLFPVDPRTVTDFFNRPNETPLVGANSGHTWSRFVGTGLSVINGQCGAPSIADTADVINAGFADGTMKTTWSAALATQAYMLARVVDVLNYLRLDALGKLEQVVAGVATTRGTISGGSILSGDVIALVLTGTSVVVKRNGVSALTTTTTLTTGTRFGLRIAASTGHRFSAFSVTP